MQHPERSAADGPRSPVAVAAMCAIGLACVMFDQTSLVVAVATIGRDLDAGIAGLQWLSAIMPLVAASTMPISGSLAARYGARNTLRAGLLIFACGAAAAALATSLPMLIGARVVQGIGAALILPNGPAALGANVPSGRQRQRAVGYWLVMSSAGIILGPLVGGVLVEEIGWRVTFVALVPFALVGAAVTSLLADTPRASPGRLDVAGLVTSCLALATLSWALIETGRGSAPAPFVAAGYAVAAALFYTFIRVERRAVNPVMDLTVLGSPVLRVLLPAVLIYNGIINGSAFVLSIHLQEGRELSAATTGALLVIANLGMPLAGPVTTYLRRFVSTSSLVIATLVLLTTAYLLLALGDLLTIPMMLLPLVALGLCAGILYSVDTLATLDAADGPDSGTAMAALALMRQVGSVLGIAGLASVGGVVVSTDMADRGEQSTFIVAALILVALTAALAPRLKSQLR